MLIEDEKELNEQPQSSEELKCEERAPKKDVYPLWKRGVLLAIGLVGLNAIAFFVTICLLKMPQPDRNGAINLITYSILFLAMMGFVFVDVPKYIKQFKGWKPYVFGLAFAVGIIMFDIAYSNFVNLFYPINTSSNEASVRSVISLYPISSVFILGILGPLCEELAYRVGLFGLLRRVHRALAYTVTGLVFGLLHFDFTSPDLINELIFLPTYIMPGVILSLAYDLFGLPCSWFAHSLNNLFAIIMNILATKLE